MIGNEGRGVAMISPMLTITRLHNSISAAGSMRRYGTVNYTTSIYNCTCICSCEYWGEVNTGYTCVHLYWEVYFCIELNACAYVISYRL